MNAACAAVVVLVSALPVAAQGEDGRAHAHSAALAGVQAYEQKRYPEAIELFSRAEQAFHAPVHLLYLARSHAKLGQLLKARDIYKKLSEEALPKDSPRPFREAVQSGKRELAEIESKVPSVSVLVQGAGAQNVRVTRDGSDVPREMVGVPHALDPGEYKLQAFATGMQSDPVTVTIAEGSKATVVLTLRDLPRDQSATPTVTSNPKPVEPGGPPVQEPGVSGLRIGAYVGFGVGVVGATVGTIFLVQSGSTRSEAQDAYAACGGRLCTPAEYETVAGLDADADSQRNIGIGGLVVGGVGLATGVTLLIMDLGRGRGAAEARLRPVVGVGYTGVTGRF